MVELVVIFLVATLGSLVRLFADLMLKVLAVKAHVMAAGSDHNWTSPMVPLVDPVLKFGFIVACYGIIVISLLSAFPGALALERSALAFSLLGAGGLIGEIADSGTVTPTPSLEADSKVPARHRPVSRRLTFALTAALTFVLNFGVAMLITGRDLVEIVPAEQLLKAHVPELDAVVVVARRSYDHLNDTNGTD